MPINSVHDLTYIAIFCGVDTHNENYIGTVLIVVLDIFLLAYKIQLFVYIVSNCLLCLHCQVSLADTISMFCDDKQTDLNFVMICIFVVTNAVNRI